MNLLRAASLLASFAAAGFAQTASLSGFVTDSTGAFVPSVDIVLKQTQRNLTFQTASDESGRYLFQSLPVGAYTLDARAAGFKSYHQADMSLTVDLKALLNITLEVGDVTESVQVTGQVSRVDTETATIQQLVDAKRVVDLPLNGRNVYQLATLVAGTGKGGFNINGSRGFDRDAGANVRIDGALNIEQSFLRLLPAPSPDAVQEFTIQTSVPSAKYAYSGGVIEIATKSGTNQLHGAVYEFFRNDALDARSFFSPTKTKRRRNQYGIAAGGPVWFPGYNGKNRTFWFFNFEQQKEPLGAVTTTFVPTAAQLEGDFSGLGRSIRDPLTNSPFPGAVVPKSRLDPLAMNILKEFVPLAQQSDGRYIYQRPADSNPTQILARGDHNFGANQFSYRTFLTRLRSPQANGNLPYFSDLRTFDRSDLHSVSFTRIVSPRAVNLFRVSYNNRDLGVAATPGKHDIFTPEKLRELGFSDQYYNTTTHAPLMTVTGFFTFNATSTTYTFLAPTYTIEDDYSLHLGKHNLSLGVRLMRTYYAVRDNDVREAGSFTFSGQNTGAGLTDFMLGRPTAFEQQNRQYANIHGSYAGMYLQDDIKLTPRLSINLGLRYELPFAQVDEDAKETVFLPGSTQRSTVFNNAPAGLLFYGDPGVSRSGRKTPNRQFGPRVGFSYALTADQKTVLRAGYGLLYAPTWTNVEGQYINRQPWVSRYSINLPFSTADPWRNQPSFPNGNPFPVPERNADFLFRDGDVFSYMPNYTEPNSQHWNLNIQRELAHDYLVTLAYVGTKGTHLLLRHDRNAAIYTPGSSTLANLNQRRPFYPPLTVIEMIESSGNSSFHSAQVSLDKRFSKGFSVLSSYTFGKSLDTQIGGYAAFPQNPADYNAERGPSTYDRTHALVNSAVWDLPSAAGRNAILRQALGGWQMSAIVQLYSGTPLSLTTGQDRALRGLTNRPDRQRDAKLDSGRPRTDLVTRYFDTSAYTPNGAGMFGSAPRSDSQLRGPGSVDTNISVNKMFHIRESKALQLRSEFFNLVNRPNFGNPGVNIDAPGSFGRITSAGDGRIIQFALKFLF